MGKKLAVALVLSLLVIPATIIGSQYANQAAQMPVYHNDLGMASFQNYTIYSSAVTPGLLQAIVSYSMQWNVQPTVFGSLIQLSIPKSASLSTASFLSSLSRTYGITYFLDNSSLMFTPQISYSRMSTDQAVPSQQYLPSTIYRAYNYSFADRNNIMGNGTTIVIIDAYGDPYLQYDISAFDNITGLPPTQLSVKYLNNTPLQYNRSWALETAMDVEWAHASAPGARVMLLIASNPGSSLSDAVSYAISHRLGNVISLSWGAAESSIVKQIGVSGLEALSNVYAQAQKENITIMSASGDNGAYDGTSGLAVNYPASDPLVTGVGGTSLFKYQTKYTESAWGGSNSLGTFGSGGGYSNIFPNPYWQVATNFNSSNRGVPDVSAVADKYTGVLVIFGGDAYKAGGTSLSTPIWAGIAARLDQYAGYSIGFMNPFLYQVSRTALYKNAFNQITKGTNGYYNASAGWNPVTGLGTPNVTGLMSALKQITEQNGFNIEFQNAYNSSGIRAVLNVGSDSGSLIRNGTVYYYVSLYHSSSMQLKFGIATNDTGVYALTDLHYRDQNFTLSHFIEAYPFSTLNYQLSMTWKGYYVNVSAGSYTTSLRMFLPFEGNSVPAIGTSVSGSLTNVTDYQRAYFANIEQLNGSAWEGPGLLNESHYSGIIGDPYYSSLSGIYDNGTVNVESSVPQVNGILYGDVTPFPEITYKLSYEEPLLVSLNVSRNRVVNGWIVNNATISGNSFYAKSSGYYRITAVSSTGNLTRTIYVERTFESSLIINNTVSGYQTPVNLTINQISKSELQFYGVVTYNYTSIQGFNYIEISAPGYAGQILNLRENTSHNVSLIPLDSMVTLQVSPGSAAVSIDNSSLAGHRGIFRDMLVPGHYNVKITDRGYSNFTEEIFVTPHLNFSQSVQLEPEKSLGFVSLNGTVKDGVFVFKLKGVQVSLNNTVYTFTNSTGHFQLYLTPGNHTLHFSEPFYNNTSDTFNLTAARTVNVNMFGDGLNSLPFYSIKLSFAFPLLFFFLYLTWSSSSPVSNYVIYISTSQDFNTYTKLNVTGSQNYAILNILPARTYYVQIFGYSSLGKIISSNEIVVPGGSLLDILINSLIFAGIAIYLAFVVRLVRRLFMKKRY